MYTLLNIEMSHIHIYIYLFFKSYILKIMRLPGIEPGSPRWQRGILPLDHKRLR